MKSTVRPARASSGISVRDEHPPRPGCIVGIAAICLTPLNITGIPLTPSWTSSLMSIAKAVFPAAEAYALHRDRLEAHAAQYDPRVSVRVSISVPWHKPGTAPVGLMLMGVDCGDRRLLPQAAAAEALVLPAVSG